MHEIDWQLKFKLNEKKGKKENKKKITIYYNNK